VRYFIEQFAQVKVKYPMSDKLSISAAQSRAARALIDWTRAQLAEASGVSAATLADFEAGKRTPYDRTLADVRSALEAAGVEFIAENGGGAGVRLRKPGPQGSADATIAVEDLNATNDE
jgi:transcriptional regulator with XRE-family HTH domain